MRLVDSEHGGNLSILSFLSDCVKHPGVLFGAESKVNIVSVGSGIYSTMKTFSISSAKLLWGIMPFSSKGFSMNLKPSRISNNWIKQICSCV